MIQYCGMKGHNNNYFQLDLIHLGAKYGPCMRWDERIDRQIMNDRIKVDFNNYLLNIYFRLGFGLVNTINAYLRLKMLLCWRNLNAY